MRLSHTSALVLLLLGDDIFETAAAKAHLSRLDLSAGQPLYDTLTAFSPEYHSIVKNRKYSVLNFVKTLSDAGRLPAQIVIAAAGMDAMGIEIASRYSAVNLYEIDEAFMSEKAAMSPQPNCHFLAADLSQTEVCTDLLRAAGWQPDAPTLIVFEGITYYVPPTVLTNLTQATQADYAIADYMKLAKDINQAANESCDFCFGEVLTAEEYAKISRFDNASLRATLQLPLLESVEMYQAEFSRTQKNTIFPDAASSWFALSLFGKHPLHESPA